MRRNEAGPTRPFTRAMGRDDNRPMIVARCYGDEPRQIDVSDADFDSDPDHWWLERFAYIEAWLYGPDGEWWSARCTESPEAFWAWAGDIARGVHGVRSKGRRVLLVFVDANRELAMLGSPEHYAFTLPEATCGHEPSIGVNRPSHSPSTFSARLDGSEWHGGFDVHQIGNWHPDGPNANEMDVEDAAAWIVAWRQWVRRHDLGPMLMPTLARQAKRSFRRHLAMHNLNGPHSHPGDCDMHRFEHEVKERQGPRRDVLAGRYERLYYLDFTAHYLSIMATKRLPKEPVAHYPDGCPVGMAAAVAEKMCLLAKVRIGDGVRWVTTPDFDADATDEVLEMATYAVGSGSGFASWAKAMFKLRETAPSDLRLTMKGLANSLWGALGQRNWTCHLREHRPSHLEGMTGPFHARTHRSVGKALTRLDVPGAERPRSEHPSHPIGAEAEAWCIDADGNYYERHSGEWAYDRFYAFGAHMLAYGRHKIDELAYHPACRPVYIHTDSVWSLTPVPDTARLPRAGQIGGIDSQIVRNVTIHPDGTRLVDDVLDAAGAGQRRDGHLFYESFENEKERREHLGDAPGALYRELLPEIS